MTDAAFGSRLACWGEPMNIAAKMTALHPALGRIDIVLGLFLELKTINSESVERDRR